MTVVVLAAGRGARLRASDQTPLRSAAQRDAARRGLKVMMPVGADGRRWIDYAVDSLAEAGGDDIVLVVPEDHEEIRDHLRRAPRPLPRIRYAVQATPDGTAGAVLAAAATVDAPWCLVVNGDTLYPAAAVAAAAAIDGCGLAAFSAASLQHESGFPAEKVAAFALVECDATGVVTGLCEKPATDVLASRGPGALVSVNLWKMPRSIFDACRDVESSARGERELPAAVMLDIARGATYRVVDARGRLFDLTTAADVPLASRALATAGPPP